MKTQKSTFYTSNLKPFLVCKDHTVSHETFNISYNKEYDMLITNPQPEKLDKYYDSDDYISHTDSKKSLIDKVYQLAKNYAIKKKVKLINNNITTKDQKQRAILDIGCGTGDFLLACYRSNFSVFGVEPNKKARNLATSKLMMGLSNTKNKKSNPQFYKSLKAINNKQFDVITLWHVLEHVPNLEDYIQKIKTLLKPNGILIIAVPNYKSYDAIYYGKFWAAYDVPRHLWHFSIKAIKLLFLKEQLIVTNILPMKLDSFYVSLLSEKYKTGKTNYFKAFKIGLQSNFKAKSSKLYSSLIYIIKKG